MASVAQAGGEASAVVADPAPTLAEATTASANGSREARGDADLAVGSRRRRSTWRPLPPRFSLGIMGGEAASDTRRSGDSILRTPEVLIFALGLAALVSMLVY